MENVKMPESFAVEIKNLSFAYGKDTALKNVSLKIRSGERFGIIGPSGAGKSTLLLHLNGILSGDGEVKIDGLAVTKESLPKIRRKVGLVFQNPDDQLFNPTVEEDVAFGPLNLGLSREEAGKRVRETLKQMNLEGFETKASHHLSYAEQKRVALATVLAMQPEVVAFDEPFSNLDPAMVKHLIEIIESLEATVILVSQQILPVMASCHRLAILKDGQVIRVGTPAELAAEKGLLKECGLDVGFFCSICKKLDL